MTSDIQSGEGARTRQGRGKTRRQPAGITPRVEADPVDVVLGDMSGDASDSGVASRRDTGTPGDTPDDTGRQATRHSQRHGDTTTRPPEATAPPTTSPAASVTRHDRASRDTPRADGRPSGVAGDSTATGPASATSAPTTKAAEAERGKNFSFTLTPSLMARARSAQWHTNTRPDGYQTVSAMVRDLLAAEVARLEATYNEGQPFPRVEGRLPSGPGPEGAARGAQLRARNREAKHSEPHTAPIGATREEHPA